MNLKVSIIVLTYNQGRYLEQTLNSILNQKVDFEYEILIGEDCSIDNTREILMQYKNKYPDKIKLFLREKNKGAISNYLDILSKCKGEYISFLESEDYWTDFDKMQDQVNYLDENKEYSGIYYRVKKIDCEGKILGYLPDKNLKNEELSFLNHKDLIYEKTYNIPFFGLMFRNVFKNDLDKNFQKFYKYSKWLGDYPTLIILSNSGKIKFEDRICGDYRYITVGGTNYSSQGSLKIKDYLKFLSGMEEIYKFEFSNEEKYMKKFALHEIIYLKLLIKEKKIKLFFKYFLLKRKFSWLFYIKLFYQKINFKKE